MRLWAVIICKLGQRYFWGALFTCALGVRFPQADFSLPIHIAECIGDDALVEDRNARSSSQRRFEFRLLRNTGLAFGRSRTHTIFKVIA